MEDDSGLPGPPPLYGYEPFDPEKWRRPKRTKPSFRSIKTSEYVKLLFQRFVLLLHKVHLGVFVQQFGHHLLLILNPN